MIFINEALNLKEKKEWSEAKKRESFASLSTVSSFFRCSFCIFQCSMCVFLCGYIVCVGVFSEIDR